MTHKPPNFLAQLTGCFAKPVAENPTVVMVEAAYRHHGLNWRYINCEVPPELLGELKKRFHSDFPRICCLLLHELARNTGAS